MSEILTVSIDSERAAAMSDDEWLAYWNGQGAVIRSQAVAMARIEDHARRSRAHKGKHGKSEQPKEG